MNDTYKAAQNTAHNDTDERRYPSDSEKACSFFPCLENELVPNWNQLIPSSMMTLAIAAAQSAVKLSSDHAEKFIQFGKTLSECDVLSNSIKEAFQKIDMLQDLVHSITHNTDITAQKIFVFEESEKILTAALQLHTFFDGEKTVIEYLSSNRKVLREALLQFYKECDTME